MIAHIKHWWRERRYPKAERYARARLAEIVADTLASGTPMAYKHRREAAMRGGKS